MNRLIRSLVLRLVRIFYPHIEVLGRERLPVSGPVLFVLNHPNSLLDPLLLMAVLDQKVAFLAKSTLFKNPATRRIFRAFGALPIHRQQDIGLPGGAIDRGPERNEQTFERCRALLRQGQFLALFPEGETHSNPALLPMKTGAARIALSAEAESGWRLGLTIIPVGLWYENKTRFRSAALLVVGNPFCIDSFEVVYTADQRQAARKLTARIVEGLSEVVLQAEDAELLSGTTTLAAWLAEQNRPPTLAQLYERATALLAAYRSQTRSEPSPLRRLGQQAQHYAQSLRRFGVREPWMLDLSAAKRRRLILLGIVLLSSLPLAVAGFVLSYLPYRLTRVIAFRMSKHPAQLGTNKLVVGSLLMPANWLALTALIARWAGRWRGLQLLLAAPLLSYIALRWSEGWRELRELLNLTWLHDFRVQLARQLIERRRQLRTEMAGLFHDLERSPSLEPPQEYEE